MHRPAIIRRLRPCEADQVRDHLLRLEPDERRLRFGGLVSDASIAAQCDAIDWSRTIMIGYLIDGSLRGLGELKPLPASRPRAAEAAFSVERPFQNRGVGTELMRRLIVIARNRSIRRLRMICVPENGKVVRIARDLGAELEFHQGEVDARLTLPWPNHLTLMLELIDESRSLLHPLRPPSLPFGGPWPAPAMSRSQAS